jgi:hypothetical protein
LSRTDRQWLTAVHPDDRIGVRLECPTGHRWWQLFDAPDVDQPDAPIPCRCRTCGAQFSMPIERREWIRTELARRRAMR